jgi:hypothetical protein
MQRHLLSVEYNQPEPNVVRVTLTVAGYDQGRKYSGWFSRSGEWFAEYRNHWIFIIVGFLAGILGGLFADVLKSLLHRL